MATESSPGVLRSDRYGFVFLYAVAGRRVLHVEKELLVGRRRRVRTMRIHIMDVKEDRCAVERLSHWMARSVTSVALGL